MNRIKIIFFILLCSIFTIHAQGFSISSQGKISYKIASEQNSFTVRYTSSADEANLFIAFPFKNSLPNDYTIAWNINSSGSKPGYNIFIRDSDGAFWKGMKKFTIPSKGTGSISKVHFSHPSDSGLDSPISIDSLYISVTIPKKGKGSFTFSKFNLEENFLTAKRELMPVMLTETRFDIASMMMDNDSATYQTFQPGVNQLNLNYRNPRSPGAILFQRAQSLELSIRVYMLNGKKKKLLGEVAGSTRKNIYIPLTQHEATEYQVEFIAKYLFDLTEITLLPDEVNDHPVHFHRILAEAAPQGFYPRAYTGNPSIKTLLWKNGKKRAYINQDGQIELPHAGILIDPFLRINDETGTYLNAKNSVRYAPDSSRVYHVNRAYEPGELWVRAFVDTVNKTPYLNLILEAANLYHFKIKGKVFAAIRPLSSNPYSADDLRSNQEPGIFSAGIKKSALTINKNQKVYSITQPQFAAGYSFLKDEYISALNGGSSFPQLPLSDKTGLGTILLTYDFTLIPASRRLIFLAFPLENEKSDLTESQMNLEQRLRTYLPEF